MENGQNIQDNPQGTGASSSASGNLTAGARFRPYPPCPPFSPSTRSPNVAPIVTRQHADGPRRPVREVSWADYGKTHSSKKRPSMFRGLPADIHIAIAEQCEWRDLPMLCSITKWMHKICAHVLYRDVNLSVHNQGIVDVVFENEARQMWSDNSACTIHHEALAHKQASFLKALTRHPELAIHVHKLSWSMLELNDPPVFWMTIWMVLNMMTNVRHVDIAWVRDQHDIYLHKVSLPSRLFSNATSVSLVGVMGRPLPLLILKSIRVSNLQHLTISNLQECGELTHGLDPAHSDPNRITAPGRTRKSPGAMLGVLTQLNGCTALKTLTLRKVAKAAEHAFDSTLFKHDDQVYGEWATFIRSVGRTLEKLTFEQGNPSFFSSPVDPDNCRPHSLSWDGVNHHLRQIIEAEQDAAKVTGDWPLRSGCAYRPMDKSFGMTILPAIMETQWICLKEVKVVGVGAWDQHWAVLAADILAALGSHVAVAVVPYSRTFELAGLNEAMRPLP